MSFVLLISDQTCFLKNLRTSESLCKPLVYSNCSSMMLLEKEKVLMEKAGWIAFYLKNYFHRK